MPYKDCIIPPDHMIRKTWWHRYNWGNHKTYWILRRPWDLKKITISLYTNKQWKRKQNLKQNVDDSIVAIVKNIHDINILTCGIYKFLYISFKKSSNHQNMIERTLSRTDFIKFKKLFHRSLLWWRYVTIVNLIQLIYCSRFRYLIKQYSNYL